MSLQSPLFSGRRALPALALAAVCAGLAGCVVAPAYPVDAGPVVVAPYAPPAPVTEVIPVAPSPVSVWIGGFWAWGGGGYRWTPGHWGAPPHPGAVWVPHRWTPGPRGGWQMQGGHWGGRR